MTSRRSVMEPETETCPLSEVEDIDSLSVDELKASLRRETGERRRAQCMAEIQSHVMQLKLDLLDQEPDPDNFFRLLLRALLDRTESQACGVWLLDDDGARCELWMAYLGDHFYSKDDWGDLALPRQDMAAHLLGYTPGWKDTIEYTGDDARLPESVGLF